MAFEPDEPAEAPAAVEDDRATLAASRALQAAGLVAAWLYVACLHLGNDGLWYTGDAARHALNGVFWWDFLASRPAHPTEFALSYYARYPAINPTSYPPLFYLLEGIGFRALGPSPLVAKGLVLGFALLGGFYVLAWLRRWLSREAGWGAADFELQPGVIWWSHAILLNVPAMALTIAALYHARRWLDGPDPRQLYLTGAMTLAAIFTYFPSFVVVAAILGWILIEGHWKELSDRKTIVVGVVLCIAVAALIAVVSKWAPLHLSLMVPDPRALLRLGRWTYYLEQLPKLVSYPVLALAAVALIAGIGDRRARRQSFPIIVSVGAMYLGLSYLTEREMRYGLILVPPVVILALIGLCALVRWAVVATSRTLVASLALLAALHAALGWFVPVPRLEGMREVAAFFAKQAPDDRIFYEGDNNGVFTFYVRAGDPQFRRGVVRGSKLLYSSAILARWRLHERVRSSAEVVELLRRECGCQWLAIERSLVPDTVAAVQLLRQAVNGPEFERVKSFPLDAPRSDRVDVYRFRRPIETPGELALPFPILGTGTEFRAKPIERTW